MLQDKFFEHMQGAGYAGFVRGERGSTAENLTSLEYKIKQDQKRLTELSERIANEQVRYDDNHNAFMTFAEIDDSGKKSINIDKIDKWDFNYGEIPTIPNNRKKLLDYSGEIEEVWKEAKL